MGYGPIISSTFGVFLNPLSQEFNWSRSQISLAFSFSLLALCVTMPLTGRLVDRFGARRVIVPSALIFGLCLISFNFLSGRRWHFYAIYVVMGIVGGGFSMVPYSRVVSHWFDKKRGLALGLAATGAGLATFIMPALADTLITIVGWRAAYVLMGLMVVVVTIPLVGLLLKEAPQVMGLLPDGESVAHAVMERQSDQKPGMRGRQAWRTGTFWMICVAVFLVATSVVGCLIHLVPMLTDRGLSTRNAALATSLFGGAIIVGRVGAGYLLDRFFASSVAVGFFCGAALGLFLLWSGAAGGLAFIAAFLLGMGQGAEHDILAYLASRYFGLRAFGEIYSYALISFTLGGVVGPLLMGIGFDATGSYRLVLGLFLVATLVAAALMTRLGPYPIWETVAEPAPASAALDEALK
jgi:MFS family permease